MGIGRLRITTVVLLVLSLALTLGFQRPEGSATATSDLGGAEARGTGLLPNFAAQGDNLIRLLAGAFDPLADPLPAPAGIPLVDEVTLAAGGAQYWLVQVRDRQFPAVADAVARAGATIAGYVHDDTYMVRATPAQRAQIAAEPAVRWTGYYQPAWRVPVRVGDFPALLELLGEQTYRVYVFRREPDVQGVSRALAAIPGVQVIQDSGLVVDVKATAAQVPAIASLPAVEWVTVKPTAVLLNLNARWVTDTGVRDLYAATAPGRLTGAGQTAGVADTGVNYIYDANGRAHIGFSDCTGAVCKEADYTQADPGVEQSKMFNVVSNATGHRKMAAYFDLGGTGPQPLDESSHGTHTAGSVTGDQPGYSAWQGADGMAPGARLVHQNIGTAGGGLTLPGDELGGIPADIYRMWQQAYRPRNPAGVPTSSGDSGNAADYANYLPLEDARTHNNSWGLIAPVLDPGWAAALDQFVWDHEDMVIVPSAGNGGPGPASIISPSTAKNDISSGASANGRQPMASIDSMAVFSSHGPTGDGRFGPDLATPGQIVVSAKGGTTDGYHVAQGTSMSAPVLTGLSTLVRQYFWDGYGPASGDGFAGGTPDIGRRHNPSTALVKAALMNGAVRMRGWYSGADGSQRSQDGQWPSEGQGFGLVNLSNSLYFANDPTNNWYKDVYRADAEAFPVSALPAMRSYSLSLAKGEPFDLTLVWTDAPDVLAGGSPALVNNLNLTVSGPGGTYVGNNLNSRTNAGVGVAETPHGTAAPDVKNLVERVRIADPAPGVYTITVQADPIAFGRQGFALAASGRISPLGQSFTSGPAAQVDGPGAPSISGVSVDPASADTAKIRFSTSEPTTAQADVTVDGTPRTFIDSYNVGPSSFPGLNTGPVETSADYANRPVLSTAHELLLTGLDPGQTYTIVLRAGDLAGNQVAQAINHTSPTRIFQPDAPDIGQLVEGEGSGRWKTGTQLYAGDFGGEALLGAFMFRVPAGAIDPALITGAAVEAVSAHNWVIPYVSDPILSVDLLDAAVESSWGTQDYEQIRSAPRDARLNPETTFKRGAGQRYAFSFRCADLEKLKATLTEVTDGERRAAFRYESTRMEDNSLFAMEFGFNRRSNGPDLRPRLVLFSGTDPYGQPCSPATPAPTISEVGIHNGLEPGSVTVSWATDVPSDSMVLFRKQGTTDWTQVGTLARTKVHHVQVFGLDPSSDYEFVVRSTACNGATSSDTNGGAGYNFFRDPPDLGPPTVEASYDFETGNQGWIVQIVIPSSPTIWTRRAPGHESAFGWHVKPYADLTHTRLLSPTAGTTFGGTLAAVQFFASHDTEPGFDFLRVDYSSDGGASWTAAGSIDGQNEGYPAFASKQVSFANPGGPVRVRFRFTSDLLISSPFFDGVSIDKISFVSYSPVASGESLPLTGPVPPPSAGAVGLTAPPTRTGPASEADIAAGTCACVIQGAVAQPDLTLSPSDISFSKEKIVGGDRVTITATVHNAGSAPASNVPVRFTANGSQIGAIQTIASIAAGGTGTASVIWDTKHLKGNHTITVTADPANAIAESDETNNSASRIAFVRGNKVRNGSFESSSSGSSPDNWSSSGSTTYGQGGSDGERSVAAGPTGSWTSDVISVEAGRTYGASVDVSGAAGTLVVEQLSATGGVLASVTQVLSVADDGLFHTVGRTLTVAGGVTQVRVKLTGGLTGVARFDDVRMWEE